MRKISKKCIISLSHSLSDLLSDVHPTLLFPQFTVSPRFLTLFSHSSHPTISAYSLLSLLPCSLTFNLPPLFLTPISFPLHPVIAPPLSLMPLSLYRLNSLQFLTLMPQSPAPLSHPLSLPILSPLSHPTLASILSPLTSHIAPILTPHSHPTLSPFLTPNSHTHSLSPLSHTPSLALLSPLSHAPL